MLAARGRLKKFPVLIPSDYGTEPRPLVIIARNSWSIWYGEARLTGSLDEFYQITQKHEQTLTEALAKSALERGFVVVEAKLSATEGNSDSPLVAPVADALMRPVDAAVDHLCIDETRVFAVGIGRAATSLMDASCSVELNAYATLTTPLYGKRGPVPLSTFTTCDHLPRLDVAMPRITERLDRFGPIWSFFDQPDPRAGAPKPLADGRRMLSLTPKPLAKLERK